MTIIPFNPSDIQVPPFQTIINMDNQSYLLSCAWNIYAQRWYFSLTDQSSNLIINSPLIGSPLNYDIFLAPGLFEKSTLLFRAPNQTFEVGP